MIALKSIGLGGLFKSTKKVDDIMVTLKTTIDDSDVMTDIGPVATGKWAGDFDIESLTSRGSIILKKILGKRTDDLGRDTYRYTKKEAYDSMKASKDKIKKEITDLAPEEALDLVDEIKKAGGNMKFDHWDDAGGKGIDELLESHKKLFGKNSDEYKKLLAKYKKMTEKERVRYHSSITDDYHQGWNWEVDEVMDTIYGTDKVAKAAGGIISIQEGGPPSILNPPSKHKIKYITKKTYPPSLSSPTLREENRRAQEEAEFEGIWAGAPPSMKEREKMYRVQRTARLMEEDRIEAHDKKMYDRKKLYPYADMTEKEFAKAHPKVYDFMKKDPAWDWETFKTVSFANPGETFQATGAREIKPPVPLGVYSRSAKHDPGELELFMTPFGVTNYEMSSEGPFNTKKIMSDYDKAAVIMHELRHKKIIGDKELVEAQPPLAVKDVAWRNRDPSNYPIPTIDDIPEMVEPKAPPVYRHLNPPGNKEKYSGALSMHEVFNRFIDRQYGSGPKTPSSPYFDKIWRDEWAPYADKYERILKKRKDPEEGLRVLANEGGIARRPNAVPPLSGPTPQGLTFLLGDDIVKSRIK